MLPLSLLRRPRSPLVINHLPARGEKNKQYPFQDTRGNFQVVATTLRLFKNIPLPGGRFQFAMNLSAEKS